LDVESLSKLGRGWCLLVVGFVTEQPVTKLSRGRLRRLPLPGFPGIIIYRITPFIQNKKYRV
jgi:hypothetical protein